MMSKKVMALVAVLVALFVQTACNQSAEVGREQNVATENPVNITEIDVDSENSTDIDLVEPVEPEEVMVVDADNTENLANITNVDSEGATDIDLVALEDIVVADSDNSSDLTASEIAGLQFMYEEEKLARDVYLDMYDIWGQRVFQNISNSEQTHMDAIKRLIVLYEIEDISSSERGVFENSDLQELYNQLVEDGSQSIVSGLRVGAAIEEIDILDLEEYASETSNQTIRLVYDNLLQGSRNHLRAFASNIEKRDGNEYQPQFLSQDAFDIIVNMTNGSSGNNQNGQGGNGQGGNGQGGNGQGGNGQGGNGNGGNGRFRFEPGRENN